MTRVRRNPGLGLFNAPVGTVSKVVLLFLFAGPAQPSEVSNSARLPLHESELRSAYSSDGLTFYDDKRIVVSRAGRPALLAGEQNEILLVFDHAPAGSQSNQTNLAFIRSRNGGRTWSNIERIRVVERAGGPPARLGNLENACLLQTGRGSTRMFFVGVTGSRRHLYSATSRDGMEFVLDRDTRVSLTKDLYPDPVVVPLGNRLHLFTGTSPAPASPKGTDDSSESQDQSAGPAPARLLEHWFSQDSRRFLRLRSTPWEPEEAPASAVAVPKGVRAYFSMGTTIRAYSSTDGREWQREAGVRAPRGYDPAVARLKNGAYIMVYAVRRTGDEPTASPATLVPDDRDLVATEIHEPPIAGAENAGVPAEESTWLRDPTAALELSQSGSGDLPVPGSDDQTSQDPFETESGIGLDDSQFDFAPCPDFQSETDYLEWYRERFGSAPADNAYESYLRLASDVAEIADAAPQNHMHNDESYSSSPAPWDAADHPDWIATENHLAPFLDQFRRANRQADYALTFDEATFAPAPDGANSHLLIGLTLPHLSMHRMLTKALLAGAWKKENGKVTPDRMVQAWESALRGADHMESGSTLIEQLVGHAERRLVYDDARWALAHGVFDSPDQFRDALDALENFGTGRSDMGRIMRGEQASVMDLTQYLFTPPDEDGRPKANPERAKAVADWVGDANFADKLSGLGADDARASLEAINGYYREIADQLSVGYPQIRAADVDATAERYQKMGTWSSVVLPGLSRALQIRTRVEATNRATRLSYHAHMFRARTGRWPRSLDELPLDAGDDARTDPLSGLDFGYRLTESGPRIYSASENAQDDGGVHHPRWGDKGEPENSDDFVFWPPQPSP